VASMILSPSFGITRSTIAIAFMRFSIVEFR
jgi:hypothetical protein